MRELWRIKRHLQPSSILHPFSSSFGLSQPNNAKAGVASGPGCSVSGIQPALQRSLGACLCPDLYFIKTIFLMAVNVCD